MATPAERLELEQEEILRFQRALNCRMQDYGDVELREKVMFVQWTDNLLS